MTKQLILGTAVAGLICTGAAFAEDTFKLNELTCFDVQSLPEEDSLFVTAMLIGYASGTSGSAEMLPSDIQKKVEAMDATCGENPDMPAIEALS